MKPSCLVPFAILAVAGVSSGQGVSSPADPATTGTPPVVVQVGSTRVSSDEEVILRIEDIAPAEMREALRPFVQSLAPGAISTAAVEPAPDPEITLHWKGPAGRAGVVPIQDDAFRFRPGGEGLYELHVRYRDPILGCELRVPESPETFHLEIVPTASRIEILEGTGSVRALFGEKIPVRIKMRGIDKLGRVTLHSRIEGGDAVIERAMELESSRGDEGTYRGFLEHPLAAGTALDYWILLEDTRGVTSEYGSADSPHRLLPQSLDSAP